MLAREWGLSGLARRRKVRRPAEVDRVVERCGLSARDGIDIDAEAADAVLILPEGKTALTRGGVAAHEALMRFLHR